MFTAMFMLHIYCLPACMCMCMCVCVYAFHPAAPELASMLFPPHSFLSSCLLPELTPSLPACSPYRGL